MFRWPWVSRGAFEAMLDAKNEVIRYQRERIKELEQRPPAPAAITVQLPPELMVEQPAQVRRKPREEREEKPRIDYANLDENDPHTLAYLAKEQLGTRFNSYQLRQAVHQIRTQIVAARAARERPREVEPESNEEVPDRIRQMLDAAVRGDSVALAQLSERQD